MREKSGAHYPYQKHRLGKWVDIAWPFKVAPCRGHNEKTIYIYVDDFLLVDTLTLCQRGSDNLGVAFLAGST